MSEDQLICEYCHRAYSWEKNCTECEGCGNFMAQVQVEEYTVSPHGIVGLFYGTFESVKIFVLDLWGGI